MGLGMKNSHFCSAVSNYSKPLRSSRRMEKLQCYFHFSFPLLVTYAASEALSLCTRSWMCKTKSVQHTPSNETLWGKQPPDTLWDLLSSYFFSFFNSISAIASAVAECKALPLQKPVAAGLRLLPLSKKNASWQLFGMKGELRAGVTLAERVGSHRFLKLHNEWNV